MQLFKSDSVAVIKVWGGGRGGMGGGLWQCYERGMGGGLWQCYERG